MSSLKDTLERLGDLHDASVTSIHWNAALSDLQFSFQDIYASFQGLSNYPGPESGSILLRQVKELGIDFTLGENGRCRIYGFTVEELEDCFVATVNFSPGGRIIAKFKSAIFPEAHDVNGS